MSPHAEQARSQREQPVNADQFCNLCDVSLDLHDGPGTCHLAAQKEFIVALPFALLSGAR